MAGCDMDKDFLLGSSFAAGLGTAVGTAAM